MKIKFSEKDSLYKIFRTIEKLPKTKQVFIYIESWNEFFDNNWWWIQLIEKLNNLELDYYFLIDNDKTKNFFTTIWTNRIVIKSFNFKEYFYNLFSGLIKNTWNSSFVKRKSWIFYILIVLEISAVLYLFYFFYTLISPYTNIIIKPSYHIEEVVYNYNVYPDNNFDEYENYRLISVPYKTWFVDYKYVMNIKVNNVKYLQNPAKWKISIINELDKDYSLVANTKFITNDWKLFRAIDWFNVPSKSWINTWSTQIIIEAMETDIDWNVIWARWNLESWEILYIQKLNDSFYLKQVYWKVENAFLWGETIEEWIVSIEDIDLLNNKLKEHLDSNKRIILENEIVKKENEIILSFDDFISYEIIDININSEPWDTKSEIVWEINARMYYRYIDRDNMKKWIYEYLDQRSSDNLKLLDIERQSLVIYEKEQTWKSYVIPIKADVIWWYNFEVDVNWIIDKIKREISWKTKNDAKNLILNYPEIDATVIELYPSWYDVIPNLKSRINIKITN